MEKLVPGGIAEVSPLYGGAGEGVGAPVCRSGSDPRADVDDIWLLREIIIIMKASVIPPTIVPSRNLDGF